MTTNSFNELHKPEVESKPLWDIINKIVAYPAIVVAYDLKLFELLKFKPLTFDEITTMFKNAGFIDINIKLTGFDFWSLVVATKSLHLPTLHINTIKLCS